MPFTDIYVETSAYNLLMCRFLLNDFHVYAVDTIGHPGKSAEVCLSHRGYDYGKWAGEVITQIGYESMDCFGRSFGGGILAKLLCVAPKKVKKAVCWFRQASAMLFPYHQQK